MRRIHTLVTKRWRVFLLVFVVLSLTFYALNVHHAKVLGADECFGALSPKKRSPQAFTSTLEFAALDGALWRDYVGCYRVNPKARAVNTAVFLTDDLWAIFFAAFIYLLANYRDVRWTPLKRILLWTLVVAYGFDLVENTIYLMIIEVNLLPTIGTLKLMFYGLALLLALTAVGRNYLRINNAPAPDSYLGRPKDKE